MKNFKVLVFATLISFSAFANNTNPTKETKSELRTEIVKLLGKANFKFNTDLNSTIEFMVNSKGEIVVVNVNSDNTEVHTYVKSKLNYQTISTKLVKRGQIYKMPLKIVKSI